MQLTCAAWIEFIKARGSGRGKTRISCQNHTSLSRQFVILFFYNKPEIKFMHSNNHTEHYRGWLYYRTRTKHDCTSAKYIFIWDTSVTGHKQGKVGFPLRKSLRKSTSKATVNILWPSEEAFRIMELFKVSTVDACGIYLFIIWW